MSTQGNAPSILAPNLSGIKMVRCAFMDANTLWASPDVYDAIKARVDIGAYLEPIDTTPLVLADGVVEALADMPAPPVDATELAELRSAIISRISPNELGITHVAGQPVECIADAIVADVAKHKRGVDTILDPLCQCGHAWSDHVGITKVCLAHENPKTATEQHWKKIGTDGNVVTWLNEASRGECCRTPCGMRCKCRGFQHG